MKNTKLAVAVAAALALGACSSPSTKVAAPLVVTPLDLDTCVFPGTKQEAPKWVCTSELDGYEVLAVGIAEKHSAGIAHMKRLAALDARAQLGEEIASNTSQMVKEYIGTTGVSDTGTTDKVTESVLRSVSTNTLKGTKVARYAIGPRERMYVAVGINIKKARAMYKAVIATSFGNESAAWQKVKADKAFDEMSDEIIKLSEE